AMALLVRELGRLDRSEAQRELLLELNEALKGRRQVPMPKAWPDVFARLEKSSDGQVRAEATALGVTFGDPRSRPALRDVLTDPDANLTRRRQALKALVRSHDPELATKLLALLSVPELRGEAVRALAGYDDPRTSKVLLEGYPRFTPDDRRDALNTLASRVD